LAKYPILTKLIEFVAFELELVVEDEFELVFGIVVTVETAVTVLGATELVIVVALALTTVETEVTVLPCAELVIVVV
jgi:hypothetical protein